MTTTSAAAYLLDTADYPWDVSRWGFPTITLPDEKHSIRVSEDDGEFRVVLLSGGAAELIHTEMTFRGIAAQVAALATIDALIAELA
jgi:hypothetical protein